MITWLKRRLFGTRVVFWRKLYIGHNPDIVNRIKENRVDEVQIGYLYHNKNYAGGAYVQTLDGKYVASVETLSEIRPI